MPSPWDPDEERFLNRIRGRITDAQRVDVLHRCHAELKQKMQGFIHAHNSPLTQQTINNVAKLVVQKYQRELDERGINYEIKLNLDIT